MNDLFQEVRRLEELANFTPTPPARYSPSRDSLKAKKRINDLIDATRYELSILRNVEDEAGDYSPGLQVIFSNLEIITSELKQL